MGNTATVENPMLMQGRQRPLIRRKNDWRRGEPNANLQKVISQHEAIEIIEQTPSSESLGEWQAGNPMAP